MVKNDEHRDPVVPSDIGKTIGKQKQAHLNRSQMAKGGKIRHENNLIMKELFKLVKEADAKDKKVTKGKWKIGEVQLNLDDWRYFFGDNIKARNEILADIRGIRNNLAAFSKNAGDLPTLKLKTRLGSTWLVRVKELFKEITGGTLGLEYANPEDYLGVQNKNIQLQKFKSKGGHAFISIWADKNIGSSWMSWGYD